MSDAAAHASDASSLSDDAPPDGSSEETSSEASSPEDPSAGDDTGSSRRQFTKRLFAGALGASALAGCGGSASDGAASDEAANVQTQPTVRWRLASSFTRSLDTIYGAAEVLADRVEAMTDGRFQIRPYQAGDLVPAFEVLSSVQSGTVQMGHSASYYFIGQNPALAFDACVPFGLTARQYNGWIYDGGGLELMRELFADFNIINFPGGNTGMQMGGWFNVPINGLSDMQGLRMRIPGLGGDVMSEMGVNAQVLSGGEIYPSLERGAIDAAEWVGPYDDRKLGFHEIAEYYYYPGWWEPGPALTFYVNRDRWDELPTTYQEALRSAAAEANVRMLAQYDHKNPQALDQLVQGGTKLRRFPDDVMQRAQEITRQLLEDNAAESEQYRRIYDAYRQARSDAYRWFGTAEQAYANFAFPEVGGASSPS
jgi:TRAP-type mannitol/chloroaromatic compound transport system substrate-binding protein